MVASELISHVDRRYVGSYHLYMIDLETIVVSQFTRSQAVAVVTCFCRRCKTKLKEYSKESYDRKNLIVSKLGLSKLEKEMIHIWSDHACAIV